MSHPLSSRPQWPTALLFSALALAACTTAPGSIGASQPALGDGEWRFLRIDGKPPVDPAARLTLQGERIGANVGCNGMGGNWKVEDGRLIAGPLISTQMWCEGKMEQERAVSVLLSGNPEITVSGNRMELRSAGHSAQLERAAPKR